MKQKINKQLIGIALLAILITVMGVTCVYYGLFTEQVKRDLSVSAKLLKDTQLFEAENPDVNVAEIDLSTNLDELRVTWIASDGKVLYDNDLDALKLENHMNRPEIQEAFQKGEGESVRKSDTMNQNTFYYAILLDNGSVLRVATKAESIWFVFASAAPLTLILIFGIIGLCVGLSRLLTRQLIEPIENLGENIEDAASDVPYKELEPFVGMIRKQHMDILSAAKARQDFTANVSHELKTPLTAISGYAELLLGGMVADDQKPRFYQEIIKNSNRLLALINDIIRLSELDRSEKEPSFEEMDLCETVRELMEGLSVSAKSKNITLNFKGESCMIRGNKDMIRELTENLVINGIRYNNPGGRVTVRVLKRDHPVLVVKDNGIGIPASDQQRVFERFYRVDKSRSKATGGTGLGLAIVKHIVELHEARILLDSAPGVGTTIEVEF